MAGPAERLWKFRGDPSHAWIRATWAGQELDSRLPLARAVTPSTDPRFVSMITALVTERLEGQVSPAALGSPGCGTGDCCRLPAAAGRPGRPSAAS